MCQRCQARFAPTERIVNSNGELYHEHCFVCAQCFRPFPEGLFYEVRRLWGTSLILEGPWLLLNLASLSGSKAEFHTLCWLIPHLRTSGITFFSFSLPWTGSGGSSEDKEAPTSWCLLSIGSDSKCNGSVIPPSGEDASKISILVTR